MEKLATLSRREAGPARAELVDFVDAPDPLGMGVRSRIEGYTVTSREPEAVDR